MKPERFKVAQSKEMFLNVCSWGDLGSLDINCYKCEQCNVIYVIINNVNNV